MSDLTPEREQEIRKAIAGGYNELTLLLGAMDEARARVAALEKALTAYREYWEASQAVQGGIIDFDLHNAQVDRLEAATADVRALADSPAPPVTPAPHCRYCGSLDWTVTKYGRVTHKQNCPHRTDPWHQGDPLVRQHEDDGA